VLFAKAKPYDRSECLAEADRLRAKGKVKKAIAEYRKVLEHQPNDPVVHGKVAPLFAQARLREEALKSFAAAVHGYEKLAFQDKALALCLQAVELYPREADLWETSARLYAERGMRADAIHLLRKSQRYFRGRRKRATAIRLLGRALEIVPFDVGTRLDLAGLLRREGQTTEARALLEQLVERVSGAELRRVRGALFIISPTPAAWWRWFRAALA
jgi:tetratricopeptide (TPR) repeat protein